MTEAVSELQCIIIQLVMQAVSFSADKLETEARAVGGMQRRQTTNASQYDIPREREAGMGHVQAMLS